jgi:hypothetical protein
MFAGLMSMDQGPLSEAIEVPLSGEGVDSLWIRVCFAEYVARCLTLCEINEN